MLAGTPAQLDDATDLLNAYGISGIQRTGRIALPRVGRSASRLRSVS
jgi:acetolactate synthase small subunit